MRTSTVGLAPIDERTAAAGDKKMNDDNADNASTTFTLNSKHASAIPLEVWHADHLTCLDCTDNALTAIPPSVAALRQLQQLHLARNRE